MSTSRISRRVQDLTARSCWINCCALVVLQTSIPLGGHSYRQTPRDQGQPLSGGLRWTWISGSYQSSAQLPCCIPVSSQKTATASAQRVVVPHTDSVGAHTYVRPHSRRRHLRLVPDSRRCTPNPHSVSWHSPFPCAEQPPPMLAQHATPASRTVRIGRQYAFRSHSTPGCG